MGYSKVLVGYASRFGTIKDGEHSCGTGRCAHPTGLPFVLNLYPMGESDPSTCLHYK
jgi:hypothetical protein